MLWRKLKTGHKLQEPDCYIYWMFFKLPRNSSLVIRSFLTGLTHLVKSFLLHACHPFPAVLLCHTPSTSYFQYFHYSVLPVCVCFQVRVDVFLVSPAVLPLPVSPCVLAATPCATHEATAAAVSHQQTVLTKKNLTMRSLSRLILYHPSIIPGFTF